MRSSFAIRLAVSAALAAASGACKSKNYAQVRDAAVAACPVKPDDTADDKSVPKDGELAGCDDATLTAELRSLTDSISKIETKSEAAEQEQDKADGKKTPSAGLSLADDYQRLAQELADLKREVQRYQDRATALERELGRRTGRPEEAGICVYVRGGQEITNCATGRTKTGCTAFVRTNAAYFYRFGKCDDFRVTEDFEETNERLTGACVQVGQDFRTGPCRQAKLGDCFETDADFLSKAFRENKACSKFPQGESFEGMTPTTAPSLGATRFESDCRYAGGTFRRNAAQVAVCACGPTELVESLFYQRRTDSCSGVLKNGGAADTSVTAEVKAAFRRSCEKAGERVTDDPFAGDGQSCACGATKLSLSVFARDYRDGHQAAFEDACRRNARDTANLQTKDSPSAVVRLPNGQKSGNGGTIQRGRCTCRWDGQNCGVFKDGRALATMGPLDKASFNCGNSKPGTSDLCMTTLASTLTGRDCQ